MDAKSYEVGMRILFSADWHIKLGQKNVPREWQRNRYKMLFKRIHDLEKDCDIHIIGGDIFDTLPKPEEIALFFEFVADCTIPTYIYDGNHEATRKGKTFLTFFESAVNHINEDVHILTDMCYTIFDGLIDIIPYTHLKNFDPNDFNAKICCTHVRGNIEPHVVEEVDLHLFNRWDVVLAGDLHAHSNSQRNILYPGSPLAITFHRNPVHNGVIIYDTTIMEYGFIPLGLPQLIRKTVTSKDEVVKTDYDHTIYEITGNILELSDVDSASELIDKKLINRQSDAVLNLHNLSIEEELKEYFEKVVNLPQSDISDIIKVFNDYYNESDME
jgi:DNA repair exonuclease SbcCD nuclease subunit